MEFAEFSAQLRNGSPRDLARKYLHSEKVSAFANEHDYVLFKSAVSAHFPLAQFVAVAGTANWPYSLNPEKHFKAYDEQSDVDTVVVSKDIFEQVWDAFRQFDHRRFNQLDTTTRNSILRHGQDIYTGFINPLWLADRFDRRKFEHLQKLNKLSNELVGYRKVKMFIFRNIDEVIDYYSRGFRDAKRKMR